MGLFQIGANGVQVGDGLRRSGSGLQVSNRLINPTVSARAQLILPVVNYRHKESGMERQEGPVVTRRRYTEDGKGTLVELDCTAHHAAIVLKVGVPKCIGKHHIRSAVRPTLIGWVN